MCCNEEQYCLLIAPQRSDGITIFHLSREAETSVDIRLMCFMHTTKSVSILRLSIHQLFHLSLV